VKLKHLIKKAIKIAIIAIGIAVISVEAPFAHRAYIRGVAEENVVQIYGQNGTGTGSHVKLEDGRIVILTNKHICKMTGPLMVKSEDLKLPIERKIIKISDKHDLCVIEGIPGHAGISISKYNPKLGEELFTLGHPRGEALNVAHGEYFDNTKINIGEEIKSDGSCEEGKLIEQQTFFGIMRACVVERNAIELSTPTYPGNSGSPVVDKFGNLVAVIFAGDPSVQNEGMAVPLLYVKEFLNEI
jgi:S1-C subfamily serine protease